MKKQVLAAILTLCMSVSMLAGCGNGEKSVEKEEVEKENDVVVENDDAEVSDDAEEGFSLPIGDGETDTLSVSGFEGWYSAVSMNDNLEVWQEVEKRTGVKIEWNMAADYDTVMQPRIASGTDLPDIFMVDGSWSNTGVYKLALDGVIQPLDDLIAKYAPDIQKVLEEDPELKALMTAPDGKIYSIPDTPKYVNDGVVQKALFIRQDWLDTLDLEMPTTMDEWYTVLKAFKEQDPNGNGIQDEVPLSGTSLEEYLLSIFLSAYDLPVGVQEWWYDEDGQVFCTYANDAYKEYITELNKWYEEGLIDTELSRDESDFQSFCSTNVVGAFSALADYEMQYNNLMETSGFPEAEWVLVHHPNGSKAAQVVKRDPTWCHYAIPTSSEKAVMAIKWMNYIWGTEEGRTLNEWGIEGKTYEVVDGKKQFTDFVLNNPDGLDVYNALRSLGASNTFLVRTPWEVYEALMEGSSSVAYSKEIDMIEPFPTVMPLEEELEVINVYSNDFKTYNTENLMKFLTGVESMDNWQSYVDGMAGMGLNELLEVKQAQYDRYAGK